MEEFVMSRRGVLSAAALGGAITAFSLGLDATVIGRHKNAFRSFSTMGYQPILHVRVCKAKCIKAIPGTKQIVHIFKDVMSIIDVGTGQFTNALTGVKRNFMYDKHGTPWVCEMENTDNNRLESYPWD